MQMLTCQLESVKAWVRATLLSLRVPHRERRPTLASVWVPRPISRMLSGVLKITQHAMVKRKRRYGSIYPSVLFPSVLLSNRGFDSNKNKQSYIFLKKYSGFFFSFIFSFIGNLTKNVIFPTVTGHKIFTHNESLFYARVTPGQSGTWPLEF